MTGAEGLPTGWMRLPLSQAIAPRGEKASPVDHPEASFIGMDHVEAQTGKIIGSVPAQSMKSAAARFKAGDVLYGRLRPYLNKVTRPKFDGLASAEFIVFPDNGFIANGFLEYRLRSRDFVSFASHLNEGDRPRVDFAQIGDFSFDVPPLPEQHRIVAKIEELFSELDAGNASLTRARAQLKTYRQALLKAAFEGKLTAPWRAANPDKLESPETLLSRIRKERDARHAAALDDWQTALSEWRVGGEAGRKPGKPSRPTEIGQAKLDSQEKVAGWLTLPLGGLAYRADLGKMLDQVKNKGSHRPYFGNINLRWGAFNIDERKTIPIEDHEVERYGICKGDLVICEGGEPGRCAVWLGQDNQYFIQKALHRVRFTGAYLPFFAYYFMTYAALSGILEEFFTGSTIKHLTASSLADVPFPICSTEEQREIVDILDAKLSSVDAIEAEITTALTRITALRQSILKKAFSGQLVPQDPADEPASALLARLAQAPAPKPRRKTKP